MLRTAIQLIQDELDRRGWSYEVLDEDRGFVRFTDPSERRHIIKYVRSKKTSTIDNSLTNDKLISQLLAAELGLRVPLTEVYSDESNARKFLDAHRPIVVKPRTSAHGKGVTTGITNNATLMSAIKAAQAYSKRVLLQEFCEGEDYRLLYIGGRLVAAVQRHPAEVVGDGSSTVEALIINENTTPERHIEGESTLEPISLDNARRFLGDSVQSIPSIGQRVVVSAAANVSSGGYSADVTDKLPPGMVAAGQTLIDHLQIGICGIDFLWDGSSQPPVFLEMNISPGLYIHERPHVGTPRPVVAAFLDWLVQDE